MDDSQETGTFGFDRSKAKYYKIDNYSTPDKLFHLGYELQYVFNINFQDAKEWEEKKVFLAGVLKIIDDNFGSMDENHLKLDKLANNIGEYLVRVFWDKGALDLNLINNLESKLNKAAILNKASIELVSFIIIPRSREKMVLKIQGKI